MPYSCSTVPVPQSSGVGKRPLWASSPQNCARVAQLARLLTQSSESPVQPCRTFPFSGPAPSQDPETSDCCGVRLRRLLARVWVGWPQAQDTVLSMMPCPGPHRTLGTESSGLGS